MCVVENVVSFHDIFYGGEFRCREEDATITCQPGRLIRASRALSVDEGKLDFHFRHHEPFAAPIQTRMHSHPEVGTFAPQTKQQAKKIPSTIQTTTP